MSLNNKQSITISILTLGEAGVGKTALSTRFIRNEFTEKYLATIGVDFFTRDYELPSCVLKVTVWDTAGQEKLRCLTSNFLRKAEGAIVCYDVTEEASFDKITYWVDKIKEKCVVPIVIVANKCDRKDDVFENEKSRTEEYAKKAKYELIRCSAKNGDNVDKAFFTLIKFALETKGYETKEFCTWLTKEYNINLTNCTYMHNKNSEKRSMKSSNVMLEHNYLFSDEANTHKWKCCKK